MTWMQHRRLPQRDEAKRRWELESTQNHCNWMKKYQNTSGIHFLDATSQAKKAAVGSSWQKQAALHKKIRALSPLDLWSLASTLASGLASAQQRHYDRRRYRMHLEINHADCTKSMQSCALCAVMPRAHVPRYCLKQREAKEQKAII